MAVALWALSDGKALSLRLLVGSLEGLVASQLWPAMASYGQLKDDRDHQHGEHGTSWNHNQQTYIDMFGPCWTR